jgi:hypothetical protein
MPTFLDGSQNLASLSVPGVYVDIIPPRPTLIGSPTNFEGLVGIAQWGPVNSPTFFSSPDNCAAIFGVPSVRARDLPTYVFAASNQGNAIGFVGVRVTDGTDTAASFIITTNCLTLTSKYTGTRGNQTQIVITAGTAASSYNISVSFPGRQPEIFSNITGTANAFWVNAAAAINSGNAFRGPSNIITASAGVGTTAPTVGTVYTLTGGTDGATTITDTTLMGVDTVPRTGMYALRSSNIDAFTLCDLNTSSLWPACDVFALSETCLAIQSTVSGDTIASAISARTTVGLDSFTTWIIMGDWPTFYDSQNAMTRLVSPSAIAVGLLGNLSPEQSPLNKRLPGVVQTQKTAAQQAYSDADLSLAETGGIDIIVGPPTTPGGSYYTFITGRNASSNTSGNGIEYTRMTLFIARTLQSKAAGSIVGRLQSMKPNDRTRTDAKALVDGFFASIKDPAVGSNGNGLIDDFATTCDLSNNPSYLQVRGFLFVYCAVRYLNVVRYFVIKLAGGGNVQVSSQATPPSPTQFQ